MNSQIKHQLSVFETLTSHCETCFGFCCAALYFTASDGFPINKEAGKPCPHLVEQYRCDIHPKLQEKGLKGCMAYECFGAGQRVAQKTYNGKDWRENPQLKNPMFDSFLTVHKLHEMRWYLNCAEMTCQDADLLSRIQGLSQNIDQLAEGTPEQLKTISIEALREQVNPLLAANSEAVRSMHKKRSASSKLKQPSEGRRDYFGADLRKFDMRGADLRGALLIAGNLSGVDLSGADMIAADLRDANLNGSDLSKCLNLTQIQINGAKGNTETKLPSYLKRPRQWV